MNHFANIYLSKRKLTDMLILVILFIAIYFPPLKIFVFSPEYILIFGFFLWAIIHFKKFSNAFLTKSIFTFFIIHFVIILYSVLIETIYQNGQHLSFDKLYYIKQIRFIINILFISLGIAAFLNHRDWTIEKLLDSFVIIGLLQSIIATFMLIFPGVKIFIINRCMNLDFLFEEKGDLLFFRIFGISSEYLFTFPIFQGFVLMIIFLNIVKKKYKYLPYVPLLILSIFFNARIGLIAIPIVFTVYFFFILTQTNKIKQLWSYSKIIFVVSLLGLAALIFSIQIVGKDIFNFIIFRGIENNTSGTNHFDNLFDRMIILPSSFLGFIFGEGRYLYQNRYDLNSDIGYINDLLFGGITYILLYIINLKRLLYNKIRNYDTTYHVLIISSFVLLLISNYKGPILANNGYLRALLLLVFLHLLNQKKWAKTS